MSCSHPIGQIRATLEAGRYRCRACRSTLGAPAILKASQEVEKRLGLLERFASNYLEAACCEGCGNWGREFVSLTFGSFCAECCRRDAETPGAGISDCLDACEMNEDVESIQGFLTPDLLEIHKGWRITFNRLALLYPQHFEGYCSKDF